MCSFGDAASDAWPPPGGEWGKVDKARSGLGERLEAGRRDRCADLGEGASHQTQVQGTQGRRVLLGEFEEGAVAQPDAVVFGRLGREAQIGHHRGQSLGGLGGADLLGRGDLLDEIAAPVAACGLGSGARIGTRGQLSKEDLGQQVVLTPPTAVHPRMWCVNGSRPAPAGWLLQLAVDQTDRKSVV